MLISVDELTVSKALEKFYGRELVGDDAFTKSVNYIEIGRFKIPFPNFVQRRELIYLHDINHLLTGYDTSQLGEGEVAAYELASGFPAHCWIGYLYSPFALLGGLFLNPQRVFKAMRRGWGSKNACHANFPKEELFKMRLGDLKTALQIPAAI